MKIKIYISNAAADDSYAQTLIKHLQLVDIDILHPSQLLASQEVPTPTTYMKAAQLTIILLSSDYIHENNIQELLQHPCNILFVQLRPIDIHSITDKTTHEFHFTQKALSLQNENAYVSLVEKICQILDIQKPKQQLLIYLKILLVLLKLDI